MSNSSLFIFLCANETLVNGSPRFAFDTFVKMSLDHLNRYVIISSFGSVSKLKITFLSFSLDAGSDA